MSLFNELKRRNVFRVGIAYVIAGWLVAQVVEMAAESFGAPAWIMKMLLTFLALGMPVALIFAWAFEMTPDGIKKEKDVDRSQSITQHTGRKLDFTIIAVLVVALAYFAVDKFYLTPAAHSTAASAADEQAETKTPQTIAVLPFVDMSPDGDNEYFSDGLTEELLNILAKIKELRVAGRTSSFAFKGKNEDLRSIGQKLGVNTILEGSVRKDNKRNRVRITAQLVNVDDGFHLWSETYDRDLEDIFAIQEDIAREVAAALRITLLGEDEARISEQARTNLNAYDLYLQGLEQVNEYSWTSLIAATETLQQAIELDPDYVPAQLKLAEAWVEAAQTGATSKDEAIANARPLLEAVLERDPVNSDAHVQMAIIYRLLRMNSEAETEFQLALDANSRNVNALREVGRALFGDGNTQRAMEYLQEAERIDPYSVAVLWDLCVTNVFLINTEKTMEYAKRIGEIQPGNPMQYYGPGFVYKLNGELAKALQWGIKAFEADPEDPENPADLAVIWTSLGDLEQAEYWAAKADEIGADRPVPIKARIVMYQFREQYGLAADVAKRALDRGLDDRQRSDAVFRNAYVSDLISRGRINDALTFYKERRPKAFETPLSIDAASPRGANQLVEIASLLLMQEPGSIHATELIDVAEQKMQLRDDAQLPWARSLDRASIASARNDKAAAIEFLFEAWNRNFRGEWRNAMTTSFVFNSLRQEPEFKRLLNMFEDDMERQREEAYALPGVNK